MAQKTLNARILLRGEVDNSFGKIGDTLTNLGSQVDQISQQLIDFGKKSLNVYKDYEYNIRALETVWGTNGTFRKGSQELKNAIGEMENAASQWAANSIFHTNDISNAMVEAAHSGWDMEQMLSGIPTAMRLAQAGDMDLSEALDYLLKSMHSFGMEYSEFPKFVDEWIYAANRSAGTAREFGETMLKMGSTVQFASDPEELLALTKVMHDMGTTGSAAGTLVRNSMLKILAPSGVASKVLENLGATDDEIDAIMQDAQKLKSLNMLEEAGFSAFDAEGNAKPILQIYSELGEALAQIAGGWDHIAENETTLGVLSNIFGMRGITGALNVIKGLEEAGTLYDELRNGAAEGSTEYVASMMNDTLYGSTELYLSKVEELERKVGEELSPMVRNVMEQIGQLIDGISGMDDSSFSAIIGGLTGLAAAGPSLLFAGGALRIIGHLFTPGGAMALGAVALTSIVGALKALEEFNFQDTFGEIENWDTTLADEKLQGITDQFTLANKTIETFKTDIENAAESYRDASNEFSRKLLGDFLGEGFGDTDLSEYFKLGEEMRRQVEDGARGQYALGAEYWMNLLLGGPTGEDQAGATQGEWDAFGTLAGLLEEDYNENISRIQAISDGINETLMSAFNNGQLTKDDYDAIVSYMEQYNQLIAEQEALAQRRQTEAEIRRDLRKAQGMSAEAAGKYLDEHVTGRRDEMLGVMEDDYLLNTAYAEVLYNEGMARAESDEERAKLEADYRAAIEDAEAKYAAKRNETYSMFDSFILDTYEALMESSGARGSWDEMMGLAGMVTGGSLDARTAAGMFGGRWNVMHRILSQMEGNLGGREEMLERIAYYREAGDAEMAGELEKVMAAIMIAGKLDVSQIAGAEEMIEAIEPRVTAAGILSDLEAAGQQNVLNFLRSGGYESLSQEGLQVAGDTLARLSEFYDLYALAENGNLYSAAWNLMNMGEGAEAYRIGAEEAGLEAKSAMEETISPVEAEVVVPNAQAEAQAVRDVFTGTLADIPVTVTPHIGPGGGQSATLEAYAEGGRATEPAIYGEAGPEWFIPERHTGKTAGLLIAAAHASGFSMGELAGMAGARMFAEGGTTGSLNWGGLGGGGSGASVGIQVQYSPVIHADDERGVERTLREDKNRLKRLLEDILEDRALYEDMVMFK